MDVSWPPKGEQRLCLTAWWDKEATDSVVCSDHDGLLVCVVMSWPMVHQLPIEYGKTGWIRASSMGTVADLQSVADLHAAPFFANSMMVEFAGDQVLKFYNSHLLELTWTCSGEDWALRWRIFAFLFVTLEYDRSNYTKYIQIWHKLTPAQTNDDSLPSKKINITRGGPLEAFPPSESLLVSRDAIELLPRSLEIRWNIREA